MHEQETSSSDFKLIMTLDRERGETANGLLGREGRKLESGKMFMDS